MFTDLSVESSHLHLHRPDVICIEMIRHGLAKVRS